MDGENFLVSLHMKVSKVVPYQILVMHTQFYIEQQPETLQKQKPQQTVQASWLITPGTSRTTEFMVFHYQTLCKQAQYVYPHRLHTIFFSDTIKSFVPSSIETT